jgi:deoxyribodipyrimidine photo-lyase
MHQALGRLARALELAGSALVVRRGPALEVLRSLAAECGATAVHWNRRYEPAALARDAAIKSALREDGIEVRSFNSALLFEPWTIQTRTGTPYRVFTPFSRACLASAIEQPVTAPPRLRPPAIWPGSLSRESLELEPRIRWDEGMRVRWGGEVSPQVEAMDFLATRLAGYLTERDRPDHDGTSRLSPWLHFGEVSPRWLWHEAGGMLHGHPDAAVRAAAEGFRRQLLWREFAHHLLYHWPETTEAPLRPEFARFPWRHDPDALRAWQRGRTGYPIIDAGMRQLWQTGWMHNRVRMLVGSFLVKDLQITWQEGARWFWDTLVDADLANNTMGWQWIAGCGADAAPYFRIFNPVTQGERFDPGGDYVRRWVPELSGLPARWIHRPWEAPVAALEAAGVALGQSYPHRIVEHDVARRLALEAFQSIKA